MSQEVTKDLAIRAMLLTASDVTDFLQQAYEFIAEQRKSFSYAQFAKLAGFKARSYGRALILGLKPVSLNAYFQLVQLFKFDKEHAEYLKLLIAKNPKNCFDLSIEEDQLEVKLARIKGRIERRQTAGLNSEKNSQCFSSREHLIVYASLSYVDEGTPFKKVVSLTGLPEKTCRAILDELVEKELAVKVFKYDSYRCIESHLIGQKLGGNDVFTKAWVDSAKVMVDKAPQSMSSKENLFLNSYLTINKKDLVPFRNELRDLLEKYLDNWCQQQGDEVVELIVGATPVAPSQEL